MTAKEYIKIVEDKRELLKEIMIEGMKYWDKACNQNAWYELYIDLSKEDLAPHWDYWIDCDSFEDTSDTDVIDVLKLGPAIAWTDWIDSIELAADMIGVSTETLISAARPWLESVEYIDSDCSDDDIDITEIARWLDDNPDDPTVQALHKALDHYIDNDQNDVYYELADYAINELMRRLQEYARDEEEQEAERAAWARGEVW